MGQFNSSISPVDPRALRATFPTWCAAVTTSMPPRGSTTSSAARFALELEFHDCGRRAQSPCPDSEDGTPEPADTAPPGIGDRHVDNRSVDVYWVVARHEFANAMADPNLLIDIERVASLLANYSVGFADCTQIGGVADGQILGSGTLVTIGKLAGIVTARHVAEVLLRLKARSAQAQIVRMPKKSGGNVVHALDLRQAEFVLSPGRDVPDGPDGPDLAFVLLSIENEATLKGTSSFYALDKVRSTLKGLAKIDMALGIVAEMTTDREVTAEGAKRRFTLMTLSGHSQDEREHDGYDLATLVPPPEAHIALPNSLGGMSGGGVWRVFYKPDGSNTVVERRLIGTALYEQFTECRTNIIHHGPRSHETKLISLIRERWSGAVPE